MSNLLPPPPALSLCLHRNASPQGAWWQSSKSLYLPIFSDEMAGNTQVCLCCTTIPDVSCQCGGALGFLNGLLHLYKYITFSSTKTHTVYTVHIKLKLHYCRHFMLYAFIKIELWTNSLDNIFFMNCVVSNTNVMFTAYKLTDAVMAANQLWLD